MVEQGEDESASDVKEGFNRIRAEKVKKLAKSSRKLSLPYIPELL
jgi:hypothetical protein